MKQNLNNLHLIKKQLMKSNDETNKIIKLQSNIKTLHIHKLSNTREIEEKYPKLKIL